MPDTIVSRVSTSLLLTDSCIAQCRGVPTLPTFGAAKVKPNGPEPDLETITEWAINYRSLITRFEKRRNTASPRDAALYSICADRLSTLAIYLGNMDRYEHEPCWSEVRPYSRSSSQDLAMGQEAKHSLFTDAQKLWTLDALLQDEEVATAMTGGNGRKGSVLSWWTSIFAVPLYDPQETS